MQTKTRDTLKMKLAIAKAAMKALNIHQRDMDIAQGKSSWKVTELSTGFSWQVSSDTSDGIKFLAA